MGFLLNPSRFSSGSLPIFAFTTTGVDNNITPLIVTSSGTAEWDLGDTTTVTANSFSHTYSDGEASHYVEITGGVASEDITRIVMFGDEITSIDFEGCTGITSYIRLYNNDITGTLTVPNCSASEFRVENNSNLESISGSENLTNLSSVYYAYSCNLTGTLLVPNAPNCTNFQINNNSNLESISGSENLVGITFYFYANLCNITGEVKIPAATSMTKVRIHGNANLTSTNDVSTLALLNNFWANDCGLTEAAVDNILIDLDTAGVSSATIKLQGGTNSAPSAASSTAITNLTGRSCTITTN